MITLDRQVTHKDWKLAERTFNNLFEGSFTTFVKPYRSKWFTLRDHVEVTEAGEAKIRMLCSPYAETLVRVFILKTGYQGKLKGQGNVKK